VSWVLKFGTKEYFQGFSDGGIVSVDICYTSVLSNSVQIFSIVQCPSLMSPMCSEILVDVMVSHSTPSLACEYEKALFYTHPMHSLNIEN